MKFIREKKNISLLLIIVLLIGMIVLSSCSNSLRRNTMSGNPEDEKYYVGYDGVNMKFTQGMPPTKIYYYGDTEDNTFDVNVEIANVGSSFAFGGIFLSGYDPQMIQIQGINPDRSSGRACSINLGSIGLGNVGGFLSCENFFIGGGKDNFEFGIRDLFSSSGTYAGTFDTNKLFGGLGVDTYFQSGAGGTSLDFDFSHPSIGAAQVEYANHGRFLIAFFSNALDFSRTFGVEYLLTGDTYEYPGGELAYINFEGNVARWAPGLDSKEEKFMVTNCYLYSTYAAPIVCIDPAPFSQDKKVCTPKPYTSTKGQGAPVAITYIEQENTPKQAIFTIHVKNTGRGQVFDFGKLEKCSPYYPSRVTGEDLNIVYIGDVRVSGDLQRLKCTPHDYVRLDPKSGEGIITCAYDVPFSGLRSAYQAPLVVELWYGYSSTMETSVTIKRAI